MSKGLELLEKMKLCWCCQDYIDNKCQREEDCVYKILEKELKALEIIKKYFWLEDFQDSVAFNGILPKSLKEKYELLKEVLL